VYIRQKTDAYVGSVTCNNKKYQISLKNAGCLHVRVTTPVGDMKSRKKNDSRASSADVARRRRRRH